MISIFTTLYLGLPAFLDFFFMGPRAYNLLRKWRSSALPGLFFVMFLASGCGLTPFQLHLFTIEAGILG